MAKTRSMAGTVTEEMIWITTTNKNLPEIVTGAKDASDQTVYVGRGKVGKSIVPGKVHEGHKGYGLYTHYKGDEQFSETYDMLVTTKPVVWKEDKDGNFPPNSIIGGTNEEGDELYYIAQAKGKHGQMNLGYLYPPNKVCVFSSYGCQHENNVYEVLAEKGR